ncbi:ferrous iron transporter B [Pendulispora albinea]|uniref:Ferrous iron transporter B n=1 Tax=Pendulispora albinea TaxID=2741071 RepID=A0ABZ2M2B1_9BACT
MSAPPSPEPSFDEKTMAREEPSSRAPKLSRPEHDASCHGPQGRDEVREARGKPLVALVGRPNSGKSSLYNAVTGARAHVGNFPGITVDILEADLTLPGGIDVSMADLPGFYTLESVIDPATDEGIARRVLDRALEEERRLLVVQVIDATQLALGLRLTRELAARPFRLLVVVSQCDILEGQGRALDKAALSDSIGAPVLAVSARDPQTSAKVREAAARALEANDPLREKPAWEPDALARKVVSDVASASAAARRRRELTARADRWLLHPLLGPVLFLGLMALVFAAVFLVADPTTNALDAGIGALGSRVSKLLGGGLLGSFVSDGLLGGAGTVLAFMPQIVILTVAMELLEASGYLARGAFLVDRLLRLLGLSGRSFVPLLMGHACAVPAISATRIVRDPRERLTTILVLPLMTCSARIPTYALVLTTFFPAGNALFKACIFVGLYFAGILSGLVASLVLRRTATRGRTLPLVLEMPAYRAPQPRVIARQSMSAALRFLREIGTSILAASAILWVLLTIPAPGASSRIEPQDAATSAASSASASSSTSTEPARTLVLERSVGAMVGRALEPLTSPVGFDWRINAGLIGSFGARELMVSTMGIIYGIEDVSDDPAPLSTRMRTTKKLDGSPAYTVRTGLALLAFFLFACQCMSTVAAIRRETKSIRWPAFVLAYTYAIAYAAALIVYQVSGFLGVG